MKKFLSLLLAAMLLMGASAGLAETLPLVDEPITLTCFMETDVKWSATKNSVAEVGSYQVIMEKTGVTIDFQHPAAGQQKERFNLLLNSTQLPDMIYYNWTNVPGGPAKYIDDGYILPLNEYLEKWAPNFMAYMENIPMCASRACWTTAPSICSPCCASMKNPAAASGSRWPDSRSARIGWTSWA